MLIVHSAPDRLTSTRGGSLIRCPFYGSVTWTPFARLPDGPVVVHDEGVLRGAVPLCDPCAHGRTVPSRCPPVGPYGRSEWPLSACAQGRLGRPPAPPSRTRRPPGRWCGDRPARTSGAPPPDRRSPRTSDRGRAAATDGSR